MIITTDPTVEIDGEPPTWAEAIASGIPYYQATSACPDVADINSCLGNGRRRRRRRDTGEAGQHDDHRYQYLDPCAAFHETLLLALARKPYRRQVVYRESPRHRE